MIKNRFIIVMLFVCIFSFFKVSNLSANNVSDEEQMLYKTYQTSVFQIQVINIATGKKNSIGSGFQFTADGYIATNYHVLSQAIRAPKRYKVESVDYKGLIEPLTILNFDVVHDIGIVKSASSSESFLKLGDSNILKGTHIFSMGNPLDLGMTIIKGLYNGLMEKSLYKKILFSGSLNPGMSGGPTFNHDGEVIGINVSTAGNQVSFLVPIEYLVELYDQLKNENNADVLVLNWQKRIEDQLVNNQNEYINKILSSEWEKAPIGDAIVPGKMLPVFKCWGGAKEKNKELFHYVYFHCSTEDEIFLSNTFTTGKIIYRYNWMTSQGLNPVRFYNMYETYYQYMEDYQNAQKSDVTNFECNTQFVELGGRDCKVSLCSRNYKKFSKLFDINLSIASVDEMDRGLLAEAIALGISKEQSLAFVQKFMKGIQWKK